MKTTAQTMLLLALMAAPAAAELTHGNRTGPIFTAERAGIPDTDLRAYTGCYDSLYAGVAGYWTNGPTLGALGYDDYKTISPTRLSAIKFVGGLTRVTGLGGSAAVMWFEFYDPTSMNLLTTFGVLLGTPGNWIWTINTGWPPFKIPHSALYRIVTNTTLTGGGAYSTTIGGHWFFTSSDALVVGSNNPAIGPPLITTAYGATFPSVHCFAFIDVPEPTTLLLLGCGILLACPRRVR
ncbi:MAG TPA: hypothetical protein VM243_20450 [Phycisphaerae bacterium]|nr:hypothetical protein [Phycisphaerae bacterium]